MSKILDWMIGNFKQMFWNLVPQIYPVRISRRMTVEAYRDVADKAQMKLVILARSWRQMYRQHLLDDMRYLAENLRISLTFTISFIRSLFVHWSVAG